MVSASAIGSWRAFRGALGRLGAVVALASTVIALSPAVAGATPTPAVTMAAFFGGSQTTSAEIPVGASWDYLVNYSCATEDCLDYVVDIPFPAGVAIGSPSYGSDIASFSRSGTIATGHTLHFTMNTPLLPGTSGQLSIPASTPSFTTADNTAFAATATMSSSALGAPTSTSGTVTLTARADVDLSAAGSLRNGGVVDDITRYQAQACLGGVLPSNVWGALGTEPGSTLVVSLATGGVVVEPGGGTFAAGTSGAPDTLTWTIGSLTSLQCFGYEFTVRYPSSDPSNAVGAAKALVVDWTAAELGKSTATYTATINHSLTGPTGPASGGLFGASLSTPRQYGSAPTKKAAIGDTIGIGTNVGNNSTTTLSSAVVEIPIPSLMRPNSISSSNSGHGPLTLEVNTTCGADRVDGTSDDNTWEPGGTASAGSNVGLNPDVAWPNGSPALPSTCHVLAARSTTTLLWPGSGASPLSVSGPVQAVKRDGSMTTEFEDFTSEPTLVATTLAGSLNRSATLTGEVDQPKSTLFVINNGPGTLSPGVFESDMSLSFSNSGNPLPNPVMTMLVPPHVTIQSWSGSGWSGAPTPTLEEVPGWAGGPNSLARWTFPAGTIVPVGQSYTITYHVVLDEFAYGNLAIAGRADSASTSVLCVYDFFGAGLDTTDLDGDGNTTENTCRWDAGIAPNPSASATVVSKVKGSFDSSFVAGPSIGNSTPGSNDAYRIVVKNNGRIELDNVTIVDRLPRAGDTNILTSASRNNSSNTFPVYLQAAPILPTLAGPVTLWYSTVDDACQPELSYSPSGCTAPNWTDWSVTAPSALSDVTNIRVDFGSNVLKPGFSYSIDLPATTPTTGATEPDFAAANLDPLNQPNERATNTAAFRARRVDNSSSLNAAEPPGVTLEMPSSFGPISPAPTPAPIMTSGIATAVHTASVTVPSGGSVHLLDGTTPVTTLVVSSVGTYVVNPTSGALTFTPVLGYTGTATAVPFRVTDVFGQTGDNNWTASVSTPAAPVASPLTSTAPINTVQQVTVTVPAGGTLRLLDGSTPVTSLTVTGVGQYSVSGGTISFTPNTGYTGTPAAVGYRLTDAYSQSAASTYTPTVTTVPISANALSSVGVGTAPQSATISVPAGGTATLLIGGTPSTTATVAGQGTWTLNASTGVITFVPVLGFHGTATPVSYRVTDAYSQTASSTYTATVNPPPPPAAPALTSSSTPEAPSATQRATAPIPPSGSVTLVDSSGASSTTVVVANEGTFVLDPATGAISFTPIDGFGGPVTPIAVRLTDAYGQQATGSYAPSIAPRKVATLPARTATSVGSTPPTISVVVPPGGSVTLIDGSGNATSEVLIAGQGTYRIDSATGELTFTPIAGFIGTPTPITYQVTYADGSKAVGSFQPTVVRGEQDTARSDGARNSLAFSGSNSALPMIELGVCSLLAGLILRRRRSRRIVQQ